MTPLQRVVAIALTVALCAAVLFGIVHGYELWRDAKVDEGKVAGRAEIQKRWDDDRAAALAQANEDARRNAAETDRRLKAQQENQRAQDALLAQARADADRLRDAVGGLQQRAAAYADAAGCGALTGDPALECVRQAAAAIGDALGRSAEIARRAAAAGDEARTRGLKCEADYDALTGPAVRRSTVSLAAAAIAACGAAAVPACRVAECGKKEPPPGGCSHVDCPHRMALTAAPPRATDGLVPPRGANTTGGY